MVSFADEVRGLLEHHGASQGQLADALGVSRVTVNGWANGRREPGEVTRRFVSAMRADDALARLHLGTRLCKMPVAWERDEVRRLVEMYGENKTTREIAEALGRPMGSVATKVRALRKRGVL